MSDRHELPERPPGAQPPRAALRAPVVAATLLAGLLGAVTAGEVIGLGVVLCALVVGLAGRLGRGRPLGWWSRLWAVLAAGLAATALLRDADWVVLPSLCAAVLLGSLSLAGGTSWVGVVSGLTRFIPQVSSGPAALLRGIGRLVPGAGTAAPALRGAALAIALLTVFGVLFASGDAAFAQLAGDALPSVDAFDALPVQVFWFAVAAALAAALATVGPAWEGAPGARRGLGRVEWGIALVALDLLFAAFVAVQLTVLFGKHEHVLSTAGLTYSEYAREGFFQLVAAAALTLAVLSGALRWARAETRGQLLLLRALLATLALLTLVVLASAAHRLDLYQDAFGASRLRLAAGATIVWLGAVLALVLGATASDRFRWLPRACVLATALTVLGFALYDPDRRIAERNVERFEDTGRVDINYLSALSADAVPALTELPPDLREQTIHHDLEDGRSWAGFNLARERARDALAEAAP